MPRTKEQYEQIRREKRGLIKDKALSLFAANGYDATSIDSIARAAGISKGLMYNYFTSKEHLLQAIWDDLVREFENMTDPGRDSEITDGEAEFFIDLFFEHLKTKRHVYKLYYQLSFQPKVVEFLQSRYDSSRAQRQQNRIICYFCRKLPHGDMQINHFTVLVFMKGLSMVATYTESVFDNDFLDSYKNALKSMFFNHKSQLINHKSQITNHKS